MAKTPNKPRAVAAEILSKGDPRRDNFAALINRCGSSNIPAVQDYVYGVLRNSDLIETVLEKVSAVHKKRVERAVFNTLKVAVFELIYTAQTPEYAIINEAAEQFKNKRKRGFVNAVLRNVQRSIATRSLSDCQPSSRFVPTKRNDGCEFNIDIFPNPQEDYSLYLSTVFSLPNWLIGRWHKAYGNQLQDICLGSNRTPLVHIRPNTTLISPSGLLELFRAEGIACELTCNSMLIITDFASKRSITGLRGYDEGFFCVQDSTAAKVASFIAPKEGDTIIDLCAAPGTKTTHLAQLLKGSGKVIATDFNAKRLEKVRDSAKRLKLNNIEIVDYDDIFKYAAKQNSIDTVLIDAPCSNTGVLAKRIEARYRITPQSISELADIGAGLLNEALTRFSRCKQVFYSTCSIESEENAQVLHTILKTNDKFAKTDELTTLPTDLNYGSDGGYVAKIAINNGA